MEYPGIVFILNGGGERYGKRVAWNSKSGDADVAFEAVSPGEYTLSALGEQDRYIASISCGDVNLLRDRLMVGGGVAPCSIEAVVRDDFASVTASLSPEAIVRMTAAGVKQSGVFLIPLDNVLQQPAIGTVLLNLGSLQMKVIPGRYLAFVSEDRNLAWYEPEVQRHLLASGRVVTLAPGESHTLILDWLPQLNESGL